MLTTPLCSFEQARGAAFTVFQGWEIPEHFGDSRAEYDAVAGGVGLLNLCHLGVLRISGRDRIRYLHNMLSNDIKNLPEGRGCYATLLTHQGHIESDLYAYRLGDEVMLECMPAGRERLAATLSRFIVADDVAVEDRSGSIGILSLQGPKAEAFLGAELGVDVSTLDSLAHRSIEGAGGPWIAIRRDRTGGGGFDLWAPIEDTVALWRGWVETGRIAPVGLRALDWLRTEAGIPWYGVDMDERSLPMELGLDHALSTTKGCYRGQEIVARVLHRGRLHRRLGAIALSSRAVPLPGSEVRDGEAKIGEVTSAAFSPRRGNTLALALLKTEFLSPGATVAVVCGGEPVPGEVVTLEMRQPVV
jgi:folate-binding protein YgfZ